MDIELPNGTVIQGVPEGTTKQQVMDKAIKAGLAKAEDFGVQAPAQPEQKYSGFLMGLKDPISGGAQLLEQALPKSLVDQVNKLNNELAKYGLVSPVGTGGVTEMVAKEQQAYEKQRQAAGESGVDLARLAGNVVSPANAVAGLRAGPVVAGAIQGALSPVASTEGDFATEKALQTGTGAIGGKIGEAVAKGVGGVLNPLVTKAEQTMRDLGVKPTAGQVLGGGYRKAEDFAQNLPLVGEMVRNAREKVLFDFNKGVINKALAKVDTELPADVVGRDAVAYAAEQVGNKYDEVLNKMKFNLDFKTTSDILGTLNKANLPSASQKEEAINVLNNVALSRFDKPTLTGQEYKAIESDLRKEAQGYLKSDKRSEQQIGEALQSVLGVFKTELHAQNPKMTPQLRRIDSAYGDLSVMQRAAANTNAENGVFTPRQYQSAVRQADITRQKSSFARGTARGQDVSEAAMDVIGKDQASTLEGRLALSGLGGYGTAAVLSPLAALGYTESGQKLIDTLIRTRPDLARQLGAQLQQQAPRIGGLLGGNVNQELNR
jgi:hypothetical protein